VLGDDNIFAVHPSVHDFDEHVISAQLAQFGLKYTSDIKGQARQGLSPINEVSFLKRSFKREGPQWFAALEPSVIHEMVRWTVNPDGTPNVQTVSQACLEACLHGRKFYEDYLRDNRA
jgi:hypothetical protein